MKITQLESFLNSFPLIKHTSSSWVDFTRLNNLKKCTQTWAFWVKSSLIKKKNLNYRKCANSSFSLNFLNLQQGLCTWHSCPQRSEIHHRKRTRTSIPSTEIEAEYVSYSATESHQDSEQRKTLDRRCNSVVFRRKIIFDQQKLEYRLYIYTVREI